MAEYKGEQSVIIDKISRSITADLRETKTDRHVGKIEVIESEFANLKTQVTPEDGLTSSLSVTSLSMSKEQNGYATLDVGYSTAKGMAGSSSIVFNSKETKARCSISLQQVPLLQHKKFSWIAENQLTFKVPRSEGAEERTVSMPTIKAIQEWISVAQGLSSEGEIYISNLYEALKNQKGRDDKPLSALEYAIRVMNGQTHFFLPQATFTITKTCKDALPEDVDKNVGKIDNSLPAPFSSLSNSWECLKAGADVDYDKQTKMGTATTTWIGLPKELGGGWDKKLYQ